MGTYANYTCFNCQLRRSAVYMKQIEITQKTGKSGWGVSFNPKRKNSARISAPRNYHSIRKKWVCKDKNACHNPDYFIELEAKLAAERAERERLRKIEDQKTETKNSIRKAIDDCLKPSIVARQGTVLKPLVNNADVKGALSEMGSAFGEQMRVNADSKLIAEIVRLGAITATSRLTSSDDIKFSIPSRRSRENIVERFFLVEKKPKQNLFQILWGWVLAYFKLVFYVSTLGVGWLLIRILRKKRPAEIYEKEIKKIAKLVSRNFNQTPLLREIVPQLKSDQKLISLPYFEECLPKLISAQVWKSVDVRKSATGGRTDSKKTETTETQILKQIYESDEFFDICMIVLMRAVGGADGKLSKDEMDTIKTKYSVSTSSEKLVKNLLNIKDHQDKILTIMNALFGSNTAVLEMIINNLMTLAEADGEVSKSELQTIHSIGKKLGLSKKSVQNIIENQNPLSDEKEGVRYFDEEFFPEYEEVMS